MSQGYRELIVWQKSMDLVVAIYKLTSEFPSSEQFGLTSQMRRSSVSIPSNIAEGRHRGSRKDYRQFLIVGHASGAELETQLEIGKRLGFGNASSYSKIEALLTEVMKMLSAMVTSLKNES